MERKPEEKRKVKDRLGAWMREARFGAAEVAGEATRLRDKALALGGNGRQVEQELAQGMERAKERELKENAEHFDVMDKFKTHVLAQVKKDPDYHDQWTAIFNRLQDDLQVPDRDLEKALRLVEKTVWACANRFLNYEMDRVRLSRNAVLDKWAAASDTIAEVTPEDLAGYTRVFIYVQRILEALAKDEKSSEREAPERLRDVVQKYLPATTTTTTAPTTTTTTAPTTATAGWTPTTPSRGRR